MGIFNFIRGKENYGQLDVVLCESYHDVGNDVLFRLTTDPPNVIRIKQEYNLLSNQNEKKHKLDMIEEEWGVEVSGISYRSVNALSFISGKNQRVILTPQPIEKYPHAIAVYGQWLDPQGKIQKEHLGYLPNDYAKQISCIIRGDKSSVLSGKLSKIFIPYKEKQTPGLRIDVAIFQHALPRFEIHGYSKVNGRKRKKTYRAKDMEEAIFKAQKDGIIVDVSKIKKIC